MCRLSCRLAVSMAVAAVFLMAAQGRSAAGPAAQAMIPDAAAARDLYLAVVINGSPTRRVAAFRRRADGGIAATRAELRDIGIDGGEGGADALVDLAALDGLAYRVDGVTQEIFITAEDGALRPTVYDAGAARRMAGPEVTPETGAGAVLNYTVFATTNADFGNWFRPGAHDPVVSGAVEARVFGPFGVFTQSALAASGLDAVGEAVRLDTTWSRSDPETLRTWRAGDFISGGLSWTRPVRLGGVQLQRNFDLQPDLVTLPVPEFSGSAAVPSTVEVYANNVRVFSRDVPAGPFVVSNVPVVTGAGTARITVSDSLGRQSVTQTPFYTAPSQLREGLYDFSIEAGLPRRSFGVRSNDYGDDPAVSASARYGVSDSLTLEGHGEASSEVVNAGAGAVFPLGFYGVASLAAAASRGGAREQGALLAASFETEVKGVTFHARTRQALGGYADLASESVRDDAGPARKKLHFGAPPRSVTQAVAAAPLWFDPARIALSYTQLEAENGDTLRTAGLSLSRPLGDASSLYATGFSELGGGENYGLFAGLTFSLGSRVSGILSVSGGRGGAAAGADVSRSGEAHPGGFGWRLRNRERDEPDRLASASYRTGSARLQGTIQQYGDAVRATAEIGGGVAVAGGNVFLTPRIHDAFALVDVGVPGVEVSRENRLAGTTDRNGRLIVPGLNAYEPNTLSIDPKNLPLDAEIASTRKVVVPADRSGVRADFGVNTARRAVRLVFSDAAGEVLPAGSRARLADSGETFVIGYDGLAYARGLAAENAVRVALVRGGSCSAKFALPERSGSGVQTLEVSCR